MQQPAQSPDFNINDLAFFRALSIAVSKVRRGKVDFDKDRLVDDVMKAWNSYDDAKIAKMWEYHDYCLKAAIDCGGGNNYPRHRSKEEKEAARLEPPLKRRREAVPVGVNKRLYAYDK